MRAIPLQAVRQVQQEEGCILHPYRDTGGRWTIFTGHLIHTTEHFAPPYTHQQADDVLRADMADAAHMVEHYCKVALNDNQFSALVCFTFNEGAGTLRDSSLLAYINGGGTNPTEIRRYFALYNKARNKQGQMMVLQDLVNRRDHEAALYLTAVA